MRLLNPSLGTDRAREEHSKATNSMKDPPYGAFPGKPLYLQEAHPALTLSHPRRYPRIPSEAGPFVGPEDEAYHQSVRLCSEGHMYL